MKPTTNEEAKMTKKKDQHAKSVPVTAKSARPRPTAAAKTARRPAVTPTPSMFAPQLSLEERTTRVAEIAYFRAEARGFVPGHEIEDWLAAENEVDRELRGS
jgi:hypothetical protein